MNSLLHLLGTFGQILQSHLFPALREELGKLSEHHEQFVRALVLLQMDGFVAVRHGRGRRPHDRSNIARAFLAKAVFHIPHTRALLDRLAHDTVLRRLCGWEKAKQIPDETVFSRAFAEFARSEFAQRVHAAVIQRTQSKRLVGHMLLDATAIEVREKPGPKPKPAAPAFTWHRLDILPQEAPRETHVPGPAATRDEYLAYCMTLIRRHFDLLSPSFLAGRRGAAVFRIIVLDDGRIARITLAQGSAFRDIDARIEEAVIAVRRFPPLPQWLQGSSAGLILQVVYPDGL